MHPSIYETIEHEADMVALTADAVEFAVEPQDDIILLNFVYVPFEPVVDGGAVVLD